VDDLDQTTGPLSDDELRWMFTLLERFCAHDLDQWASFKTESSHGTVGIHISRSFPPEANLDAFFDLRTDVRPEFRPRIDATPRSDPGV
jgi:hypothetical protein